eukprot:CAMPEP_0178399070 /NCGR_PEP_ID=MMETSP0689_2-20121128/15093_1 /TAXON_ID=160604 /ORGANISM="Amphidinium massartii, Strain CS-259" /LENGTH=541 /DNA_ID=CAMNT_0020019841 /DNA_START=83 /DNA_END=1708 /DNA_ORIENTATION=+
MVGAPPIVISQSATSRFTGLPLFQQKSVSGNPLKPIRQPHVSEPLGSRSFPSKRYEAPAQEQGKASWKRRAAQLMLGMSLLGSRLAVRTRQSRGYCLPRRHLGQVNRLNSRTRLRQAVAPVPEKIIRTTPLWTLKVTQMLLSAGTVCLIRYLAVYYDKLGLSRDLMGVLLLVFPLVSFVGQLFWSAVVDYLGDYKATLMGTTLMGVAIVFAYLVPAVQQSFPLLCAVTAAHGFFASTSGPLLDSLSLKVLSERPDTKENYGDQRIWSTVGWGGMALIAGSLVDGYGVAAIFFTYAALALANVGIIAVSMPSSSAKARTVAAQAAKGSSLRDGLRSIEARWLIANLLIYGLLMSLVENFLNVYLLQDFIGTPGILLGFATAIMCMGEVPVFKVADGFMKRRKNGIMKLLVFSELALALRCVLYAVLPASCPWLVLIVEPIHGLTFAGMWCSTVAYAQKLAPPGTEARMQALLNGLFFQLAFAMGSLMWGFFVKSPAAGGLGFRRCFLIDAVATVVWVSIWQLQIRRLKSKGHKLIDSAATPA